MTQSDSQKPELQIGRVVKSHGIRGEVVIELSTDSPEERFVPGSTLKGKQSGRELELTIETMRPHQGRLLVKFKEIPDRNGADSLRGMRFFAAPLEDPDDGYYDYQLIGLKALKDGEVVGEVTGTTDMPNRLLLEITLENGHEALVPFVEEIVPEINLEEGYLTLTPPEGLLDL
ncbi:ribosome maturation factor RimM [Corynebacterium caspium]|uniref:ribosome maturation factor RimM n=1 Tax=Corynebacterium caspium TaxID=234828 RepID=UPI00035EE13F|nr:ribosome maturation factor RimM [Corynebacterium caspium]WKD59055.1 Ribosome maturation factor RimM [Corynebacterium caspium DSM 44850]